MKHAKSNTNLLKRNLIENNKKVNIFKKQPAYLNFNTIKTTTMKKPKNYLISLLGKNNQKNSNLKKFDFITKNNNKNKKKIFLTNTFNNYNNNSKQNFNKQSQRNINIRLNLNNEIINNNFGDYFFTTKKNNFQKNNDNINLNKKIKEKDKLITKLQSELVQMQEFLNKVQKDKQNEIYLTYNTLRFNNNNNNNQKNNSLSTLLNSPSRLKFNKSTQKLRNYLHITTNNEYYSNRGFRTKKDGFKILSPTSKKRHFVRCFSSSPRIVFPHKLDKIDSNYNTFTIKSLYNKKDIKFGINYNSTSNILLKKNNKFPSSPKSYFTRQLSFSTYEYSNNLNNNNSFNEKNSYFVDKCEKLKKRTKILLNKYSSLINELSNKYKRKKK